MRKLLIFVLGFGAACALSAYAYGDYLLVAGVLCLLLSLLFWALTRWWKNCRIPGMLLLGVAVGLDWFCLFDHFYLSNAQRLDAQTVKLDIEVTDYGYETNYGCACDGKVILDGKRYQIKFYLDEYRELEPGNMVRGEFRCRFTTDGGSSEPLYYRSKGIFLVAYQEGYCAVERNRMPAPVEYPAIWRQELKRILNRTFPEDVAGFAKALLLGDRTGIGYELETAFKISGISHIIAVSGLHVSILFSVIYLLTFRRRGLTALIGIPCLLLFAAVAGFTPSITRAVVMQCLLMLSRLCEKEYDPPTSLAFACFVMLAVDPLVITSVSFQLSTACMAGIFLFSKRIRAWILDDKRFGRYTGRFVRWFSATVSVTLSSMVFTTPLVAYYFGAVSLVGVVTNLLTLWITTYVFYGILAVCVLGFISTPAAAVVAAIVAWPARYILAAAELLSMIPMAAVYTKSVYIVLWLVFAYVLLGIYLCMRQKEAMIFGSLIFGGLVLAIAFSWVEPMVDDCRVTVLDVGQGQSVILQSHGKTFLVDCGGSYDEDAADVAAETLLSQGINALDGIILTHLDRDHTGGIPYLLTRVSADAIYVPYAPDEESFLESLEGQTAVTVWEDLLLTYPGGNLTIFAPESYNSGNESGMCVLFQTEKCDILITGDREAAGEKLLLADHTIPQLEVLVVGHHGSKTSTCEELLEATRPKYALISVGADNTYGHPAREVLERLLAFGCLIFRTDLNGTIVYRG